MANQTIRETQSVVKGIETVNNVTILLPKHLLAKDLYTKANAKRAVGK